ncbi:amp-binding enzyme [Neofusicoccum parvum]|uniref:Amp-binding enzyme n=1 Tax=Neofusicoccum parvum TaxID=310453 RepID=A0ACB5S1B1_9PEZI|nr:amp-binding enzyme [Neofusicoccum parvum]
MDLVSWTLAGALPNPDAPILIDALSPSNSLSFRQISSRVRQLVAGLQAQGIKPGDCVCVNCFNDVQYSVLYLGIIGCGAIFTGVNPAYTPNELSHHFDLTKPRLLIVEPPMLEKTVTAANQAGISTDKVFVLDTETENSDQTFRSWSTLLDHGEKDWVKVEDPDTTVATYNSTSGTSGLPKAAMITHSYHVTQAAAQCEETKYPRSRLLTLPPFHAFGSPVLPSSIRQGIPTYIMRRYAEAPFLNSIAQYAITETYIPPPVLMGLPKIVDPAGEIIDADNVSGELLARCPHPLLSYISNPAATADAFTACKTYVRTGDIGYRLTDPATGVASVYIVDRAKELIKVRGWQVSPTEIESELMQHPGIADAAVIGVKDPQGFEEHIRAYIVRKVVCDCDTSDDLFVDEKQLRTWLRKRLSGYKVPAEFVFTPSVPRNGTGKILRRVLREGQKQPIHRRVDSALSDVGVNVVHPPLGSHPVRPDGTSILVEVVVTTATAPDQNVDGAQSQPGVGERSKTPISIRQKVKKVKKLVTTNKILTRMASSFAHPLRTTRHVFSRH